MIRPTGPDSEEGADIWRTITSAADGDLPGLRSLIERNPALARAEYFYTPVIHFAVREGHLDAVRLLLDAGADPEYSGYYGGGLSLMARDRGYDSIAAVLDEACDAASSGEEADHPIHGAADAGLVGSVLALLNADSSLIRRRDASGALPLHSTVMALSRGVVRLLLDRGADIHAAHGAGVPSIRMHLQPIDLALWGHRRDDVVTARLLLDRGATYDSIVASAVGDIDGLREMPDDDPSRIRETRPNGRRALSAAVGSGHGDVARLLLERGAEVAFLLSRGSPTSLPEGEEWATPLAWAERRGHAPIAQILSEAEGGR